MKKLILSVMLMGGLLAACNKEADKPTVKEEIARNWSVYEYTSDTAHYTYRQLAGSTFDLGKDNNYSLTLVPFYIRGKRGTWELNSDNTKLTLDKGNEDSMVVFRIVQLNSYMMRLKALNRNLDITYVPNQAND
jgi:hypothetical protein